MSYYLQKNATGPYNLLMAYNYEAAESGDGAAGPTADVEEVRNYVDARAFARVPLADPASPPLSMRLLNGTHERLMRGVRGATTAR